MLRRALLLLVALAIGCAFLPSGNGTATVLTTITVVNDTGSTVAAGQVTKTFGQAFKDGDLCGTCFPQFQVASNGHQVPYSWGLSRKYKSGNYKWASFMLRTPDSIGASSSLTINVMTGGTDPGTSHRSLSEVTTQAITSTAICSLNCSGTWAAVANSANKFQSVTYLDGAAGTIWGFDEPFRKSGANDGQLMARMYVAALEDGSNALGGFRELTRVWKPFYDVSSPARGPSLFSSLATTYLCTINCLGGGSKTFLLNTTATSFTASNGVADLTSTAHGYAHYTDGAGAVHGWVCGTVSGGSLPTGLSASTLYYIDVDGNNTYLISLFSLTSSSGIVPSSGGSGTFTPGYCVLQYGSQFDATSTGDWNSLGGGSFATDPGLRVQVNQTYLTQTKLTPPYPHDGSLTPTANAALATTWTVGNTDPLVLILGSTGPRSDIGPWTDWQVRALYTQSLRDDGIVRRLGLAQAHFGTFRASGAAGAGKVNVLNVDNASYTGLQAGITNFYWSPPVADSTNNSCAGITCPDTRTNGTWAFQDNGTDHIAILAYPYYLLTGSPDALDLCVDQFIDTMAQVNSNSSVALAQTLNSVNYYGIIDLGGQVRQLGWALRNVAVVSGIYPDTDPYGTQTKNYIANIATYNEQFPTQIVQHGSLANSYTKAQNLWYIPTLVMASWQESYFKFGMLAAATVDESSDAQTFMQNIATWDNTVFSLNPSLNNSYYWVITNDGTGACGSLISATSQFGGVGLSGANVTWTSGAPPSNGKFTFTGVPSGYTPTNDDIIRFPKVTQNCPDSQPSAIPAAVTPLATYYMENVTNTSGTTWTFTLSTTPANANPVTQSDSGDYGSNLQGNPVFQPTHVSSTYIWSGAGDAQGGNFVTFRAGINGQLAIGVTGLTSLANDMATRLAGNSAPDFTANPRFDFAPNY